MVVPQLLSSRSLGSEGSTTPTDRGIKKSVESLPNALQVPIDFEDDEELQRIVRKLSKFTGVKANTLIDNKLRRPLIEELTTRRQETFQAMLLLSIEDQGEVEEWTDMAFVTKIIEVVDKTYSTMPPLHPQTRLFLDHARKFLDCRREMDAKYLASGELQQLARLYVQTDSGGIETDTLGCKQQYQQQATSGEPVSSMEQLNEAAHIARPVFKGTLTRLLDSLRNVCGEFTDTINLEFPNQKEWSRALQKAKRDYCGRTPGPAISWLYDIVRASLEFSSVDQIIGFLELLKNDESIHIVQAKNRFATPGRSGYRDMLFHIQVSIEQGFKHICEIQIHHKEMKKLGEELQSQFYYEYFRSYLDGDEDELDTRLKDLETVQSESVLDDAFENLLQEQMELSEINRIITLLSDHLSEDEWAIRFCAKFLWRELNSNGPSTVSVAKAFQKLASILQKTSCGQMDEQALLLQMRALKILQQELGKGNVTVAKSHESIAAIQLSNNEPVEAMKHLQVALEIKTLMLGEEHLSVAETYNHMTAASLQMKKIADVVELCRRSLRITSQRVAEDSTDLADIYRTLAGALLRQSNYYDALENYERSLEIRKRLVGENHKSLLEDYKGILHVQFHHGRLNRVQELHRRISLIRTEVSKGADSLSGKHFIRSLKTARIAFAPICLCLNGFWYRKLSSMGISQKYLKGYLVDEAFDGVDSNDELSDFLKIPSFCVV